MKKAFSLLLLALCQFANAQTSSLIVQDIDAGNYIRAANITSRDIASQVNDWFIGLKSLGVYTNVIYMVDLHVAHGAWDYAPTAWKPSSDQYGYIETTNLQPARVMVGTNTTVYGIMTINANGAVFTNGIQAIAISNTFGSTLSALTVFAAFKAEQTGAGSHVIGGYEGSSKRGPMLWAHGTPSAGFQPTYMYNSLSGSGATNFAGHSTVAGQVSSQKISGHNQTAWTTYSPLEVKCSAGIETPSYTTNIYETTIYNGSTNWWIGLTGDQGLPLKGNFRAAVIFNRNLCFEEMAAIRRLFSVTIGKEYLAPVFIHTEGDSMTAGSGNQGIWSLHLMTNQLYGSKFQRRMQATGGHNITNCIYDFSTNIAPYNIEFPYCDKQYYSLQVGINSLANGENLEVMWNNLSALWDRASLSGYKVIAFTVTGSESLTAAQEQNRLNLNQRIRNATGRYAVLIDSANIPQLTVYGNSANPTYYVDGVHYTTAGHQVLAAEIMNKLQTP
jgi:lysophospholipase L1-like esterase